jgi:FKBP-type peptidyl-prolyl cis-trans isomerase FkpA
MKNLFKFLPIVLIISLAISGCIKDEHPEKLENEIRLLEQYIADKGYNESPSTTGLYYIEITEGTGPAPDTGDYVLINFTGKKVSDEKIFGTTVYQVADDNNLFNTNFLYGPFRLMAGNISPQGINEGIMLMKEGGVARLIFPSSLGFGRQPVGPIPAYSSLIYEVELLEVIPDLGAYENNKLNEYILENAISTQPSSEGLYYIETLEGTGDQPTALGLVDVSYTARLLDGRLIKTTTDHLVNLGGFLQGTIDPNLTVKGLRDALRMMKEGGTATVIVPYTLAFGTQAVDASSLGYKYPVPPYSTIVYEVTLKNVR